MYDILCMSRLLEKKKKKELKSRGNESHFFLTTQSFPKAKILSKYQRWSRFTIFSYYTVNYQWCHRWSPSKAIPFCSPLPHITYSWNIKWRKCGGISGLWVLNEIIQKISWKYEKNRWSRLEVACYIAQPIQPIFTQIGLDWLCYLACNF